MVDEPASHVKKTIDVVRAGKASLQINPSMCGCGNKFSKRMYLGAFAAFKTHSGTVLTGGETHCASTS